MSSIRLDPKLGVNPCLTYCPVCGHEAKELVLVGSQTEYKCADGHMNIGRPKRKTDLDWERGRRVMECGVEGCYASLTKVGKFDGTHEKLPASQPCDKCAEILKRANINICPKCRNMFECTGHQVLKTGAFASDGSGDFASIEEGVEKGFLALVVGKVSRMECEGGCKIPPVAFVAGKLLCGTHLSKGG